MDYLFLLFLTCVPNFMLIGVYLLSDPQTHVLCIILSLKNSKCKHFVDQKP